MIAEYKVNLEKKTKNELVAFISQLQSLLKQKDKQIDLMADYIYDNDQSILNYLCRKNGKCNKKMIKQYFADKVNSSEQN